MTKSDPAAYSKTLSDKSLAFWVRSHIEELTNRGYRVGWIPYPSSERPNPQIMKMRKPEIL